MYSSYALHTPESRYVLHLLAPVRLTPRPPTLVVSRNRNLAGATYKDKQSIYADRQAVRQAGRQAGGHMRFGQNKPVQHFQPCCIPFSRPTCNSTAHKSACRAALT